MIIGGLDIAQVWFCVLEYQVLCVFQAGTLAGFHLGLVGQVADTVIVSQLAIGVEVNHDALTLAVVPVDCPGELFLCLVIYGLVEANWFCAVQDFLFDLSDCHVSRFLE